MSEYRHDVEMVKKKARARADYLVRQGRIKKPALCGLCGREGNLEKHHPDYTDPERVLFWCVGCHRRFHRRLSRRTVFELLSSADIIDHGSHTENRTDLK